MPIQLVMSDNSQKLKDFIPQIVSLTEQCERSIPTYFNKRSLDINLEVTTGQFVIPETGIGGFSPNQNTIKITLDTASSYLQRHFDKAYMATLYHETHHCFRHATVGYGQTLFEAMLTEGLACHFEEETGYDKPMYVDHLSAKQRQLLIKQAEQIWQQQPYDHVSWFFGNENRGLPRWAAYDIGYYLTGIYLKKSNQTASQCHDTDSSDILNTLKED